MQYKEQGNKVSSAVVPKRLRSVQKGCPRLRRQKTADIGSPPAGAEPDVAKATMIMQ